MRKDKRLIPKGDYCYKVVPSKDSIWGKTEPCPYLKKKRNGPYCAFLEEYNDIMLADSCKICNINRDHLSEN